MQSAQESNSMLFIWRRKKDGNLHEDFYEIILKNLTFIFDMPKGFQSL